MFNLNSLVENIEKFKPYIWGLLLSSVVAKHAVGNILLIGIAVCFIIQILAKRKIKFNPSYLWVVAYFLFGGLSLLWTTNIPSTQSGITKGLYLFLIPVFLSQYRSFSTDDLQKMLRLVGTVLLGYFLISLIHSGFWFLEDNNIHHFFYHDLTSISGNNAIYISIITSSTLLLLYNLKNKSKVDYSICIGLLLYLLMLSSKSLIIATLLIQFYWSFRTNLANLQKRKTIYFLIPTLLLALLFIGFDNPIKDRFMELSSSEINEVWNGDDFLGQEFNGLTIRLFQWRIVGEMFASGQLGILGLGWNNVDYLTHQYFSYYNFYKGYYDINFHNQYLQTIGELGIAGLIILLITLFKGFNRNIYLNIFIIISLISFITESYLSRQKGVIIFVIFYCILMNLNQENEKPSHK